MTECAAIEVIPYTRKIHTLVHAPFDKAGFARGWVAEDQDLHGDRRPVRLDGVSGREEKKTTQDWFLPHRRFDEK